ncbi:hypothetical protein CEP52_005315 [Fusarium oligoseptatum]|uniref:Uncharacterized protein n=1 Tax=Fusarium oligoseptatum TaxID=2604345 RepID=A0A428TYZ2_9HYPO|nr:hypothetical protein CEP52_005315 [Fusarium oligoseptatum]
MKQWLSRHNAQGGNEQLLVLRAQCLAAFINVANILEPREMAFDDYAPEFQEIITSVEILSLNAADGGGPPLNIPDALPLFTPEMGIIHPLYFTALKYRDPFWRRRAVALLRRSGREGPWVGEIEAALASAIASEMENQQAGTQSSQTSTHSQQDEPILSCDQIRPVSPLESEPKSPSLCLVTEAIPPDSDKPPSESAIGRACTRFHNFWKAFLLKPWKMFLLLFTGTVSAIGHHFFYHNLNGKEGDAQSLMFRYGTILAFCAKASFGTAVAMAFQQRAWFVMRRKTARLDTVDSIFTANAEFTALLDWKAIKKARVSTCLALYCWLTPLVVVLTSETLSTVAAGLSDLSSCPAVRTLDFF